MRLWSTWAVCPQAQSATLYKRDPGRGGRSEEDGKKGKAKEGREEGRGNTGIESTGDQEKSWIGR